jgi:hypothetical protein
LCPPMTIERFTTSDFIDPSSLGRNKRLPAYRDTLAGGLFSCRQICTSRKTLAVQYCSISNAFL